MSGDETLPAIAIFPWGDVVEEFLDPIGLTTEDFVERMTGGWLFGYVAALRHAGWRPLIVCASDHVSTASRLIHAGTGAPIWLVPGRRVVEGRSQARYSVSRWLATPLGEIRKVVEREDCRALLIQEYEYTRFDALVRLAERLRIPAYASFQGSDRTLSWIEGLVRPRSLRKCSGLVIASSIERKRVESRYVGTHPPIASIPNPLDVEEWKATDRQAARAMLGVSRQAFVAINHGRIDIVRKGQDMLLSAWGATGGDELVIIGSGQDHELFAGLLARSGLKNVRWLSDYTTDRPLIRRWLSAADIYVSASRVEGMPVAPLEAMACGLPVLATDAQGIPEILEGGEASGGIIVAKDDAPAFTAAIERLRTDPDLRARLGKAARRRVETGFSIAAVGNALGEFMGGTSRG